VMAPNVALLRMTPRVWMLNTWASSMQGVKSRLCKRQCSASGGLSARLPEILVLWWLEFAPYSYPASHTATGLPLSEDARLSCVQPQKLNQQLLISSATSYLTPGLIWNITPGENSECCSNRIPTPNLDPPFSYDPISVTTFLGFLPG